MSQSELLAALARDDERALRALLDADPTLAAGHTESGVSYVLAARYLGMHQCLVALIEHNDALPMPEAAAVGDAEQVRALLDAATRDGDGDAARIAAANTAAADGYSSLHLAAYFGHPDIVRALIDAGADVTMISQNEARVTPLHSAVAGGEHVCVRQLLDAGADPLAEQTGGHTPIDIARVLDDEMMLTQLTATA